MKDKLEEFIVKNRDDFDFQKPGKELWNKIKPVQKKSKFNSKLLRISYRVAAVFLIFVASYAFHEFMDKREGKSLTRNDNALYRQIPELKETEFYYNNMVNLKMEELKPFLASIPGLEKEVNFDLNELDSIYTSLKNDLRDNISNDEVLEAMIQNYRLKIQILEDLLSEVKQDKSTENNEKNNYKI